MLKESGKWNTIYATKKRLNRKQETNIERGKEKNYMKKKLHLYTMNLIFNIKGYE